MNSITRKCSYKICFWILFVIGVLFLSFGIFLACFFNGLINDYIKTKISLSPENINQEKKAQWARKFKKVQAKKTREIKLTQFHEIFLTKFHFLQFQK